jgi:hypothetical protein
MKCNTFESRSVATSAMANSLSSMARSSMNGSSISNMTSTSYTNMPILNQYYSTNVNCFPDFLNSGPTSLFNYSSMKSLYFCQLLFHFIHSNHFISDLDMGAAFDQLFRQPDSQNREVFLLCTQ